jgi:hypothetical protein
MSVRFAPKAVIRRLTALTLQGFVYALTFISSSAQKPVERGVVTDLICGDKWPALARTGIYSSCPRSTSNP